MPMRAVMLPLMIMASLAGCDRKPSTPAESPKALAVEGAWVRLAAAPGRPSAGYFTIKGGPVADRLVKVRSGKVATVELHQSRKKDGLMTMTRIDGMDVPAGGTVTFAPGGTHAMLFGVDSSVAAGGTVPLTFDFQSGASVATAAHVAAAGDVMPMDHAH